MATSNSDKIEKTDTTEHNDGVLAQFLGYQIKRAWMRIQPAIQTTLADFELRIASFSCLSVIADHPGIVQSELAEVLQIDRPNLVVLIDELETRDLITRTREKRDRRRYALNATLKGRRLRDLATRAVRAREAALLTALTSTERAELLRLIGQIREPSIPEANSADANSASTGG